jgi:SAM-dependent methyltransferase
MSTVANIGAGAGSYEPVHTVLAVEPSRVMIAQRPPGSAPAIRAVAERLPIGTNAVDAALAVLTVHHWADLAEGIAEMRRIARRRLVVFTWDHTLFQRFWLVSEYLPAASRTDAALAVPIAELVALLGDPKIIPVPVPHDCVDGFGGAFWRRPRAYLDSDVRAGMSLFTLTPEAALRQGLSRLRADLDSGAWDSKHRDLLNVGQLDLGYRLLVADVS